MKYLRYLMLAIISLNYSCADFLNVNPAGEIVNDELFKNEEGFEDALYGVYSTLGKAELYGEHLSFNLTDVAAQYFYNSWEQNYTRKIQVYNYKHQDSRRVLDTVWISMYRNISYANNVLDNLKLKEPNSMRYYNLYKGEALGLRAFMHFELLRYYSESIINNPNAIGVPYRESYTFNIYKFEPIANTYEKIIRDLTEAESLLETSDKYFDGVGVNDGGFVKDRAIHMNIHAVQAILARVYWTKGMLKEAADYAMKVINSGVYKLEEMTDIESMVQGVISNKEGIFGIYSKTTFEEKTRQLMYYSSSALFPKPEYQDIYEYEYEGMDYRRDKWFKELSDFGAGGLRCLKIMDWFAIKQISRPIAKVRGINMVRLPEMYYIVSEFYLGSNDIPNAHKYIDAVLVSRGLTPYSKREGMTLSINKLNGERRKEYIAEGQYFHVMKKYNLEAFDSVTGQYFQAKDGIYIFPIPDSELDLIN